MSTVLNEYMMMIYDDDDYICLDSDGFVQW